MQYHEGSSRHPAQKMTSCSLDPVAQNKVFQMGREMRTHSEGRNLGLTINILGYSRGSFEKKHLLWVNKTTELKGQHMEEFLLLMQFWKTELDPVAGSHQNVTGCAFHHRGQLRTNADLVCRCGISVLCTVGFLDFLSFFWSCNSMTWWKWEPYGQSGEEPDKHFPCCHWILHLPKNFWRCWQLNSGPHTCWVSTLPLSYTSSPLYLYVKKMKLTWLHFTGNSGVVLFYSVHWWLQRFCP